MAGVDGGRPQGLAEGGLQSDGGGVLVGDDQGAPLQEPGNASLHGETGVDGTGADRVDRVGAQQGHGHARGLEPTHISWGTVADRHGPV